jgi:UDP-GlcNAc:undecaprenyl-phosphate GlcNAc-1-phosphate transferase
MLLDAGLRPATVVVVLGGLSLLLGLGAAFAIRLGVYRPLLVLLFLVLLAGWYVFSRDYDLAVARLRRLVRGNAPQPEPQPSEPR